MSADGRYMYHPHHQSVPPANYDYSYAPAPAASSGSYDSPPQHPPPPQYQPQPSQQRGYPPPKPHSPQHQHQHHSHQQVSQHPMQSPRSQPQPHYATLPPPQQQPPPQQHHHSQPQYTYAPSSAYNHAPPPPPQWNGENWTQPPPPPQMQPQAVQQHYAPAQQQPPPPYHQQPPPPPTSAEQGYSSSLQYPSEDTSGNNVRAMRGSGSSSLLAKDGPPAPTPPPPASNGIHTYETSIPSLNLDFIKLADAYRMIIDSAHALPPNSNSTANGSSRTPVPGLTPETLERMIHSATLGAQMLETAYSQIKNPGQPPSQPLQPKQDTDSPMQTSSEIGGAQADTGGPRKRQKAGTDENAPVQEGHTCLGCGATQTPEWRRGPMGPRTLCNACGLVYAKLIKKRVRESGRAAGQTASSTSKSKRGGAHSIADDSSIGGSGDEQEDGDGGVEEGRSFESRSQGGRD